MFEEPKRLSPTHKNNSSNTIVQNKTLNNIPMSLSKNSAIQNRVGFINPDRPQIIDYKGTNQRLGNVLQQKSIIPRKELNDNRYLNEQMGCMQLKANMFTKGDNQASNIIQRKIGFEFQTNCKISRNDPNDKGETCLPKNAKIKEEDPITVVADDNNDKFSDVEFVTKPLENYDELKKADATMKNLWTELKSENVNKDKEVACDGVGCNLSMEEEKLSGKPQVTFGTSLANIKEIAVAAQKIKVKDCPYLGKIQDPKGSNFNGIIELIKSYIRGSLGFKLLKENIEYPKRITDSFLLSRTDFGLLLSVCKESMPPTLDEWLKYFDNINIIDGYPAFDINDPLFPHIKEESGNEYNITFAVKDWLSSLYFEMKDLIQGIQDQESMSIKPLDTVPNYNAGGKEEPVGIFELRANQGIKHYLDKSPSWFEFMNYWYKVIEKTGYLPPSTVAPPVVLPPIAPK